MHFTPRRRQSPVTDRRGRIAAEIRAELGRKRVTAAALSAKVNIPPATLSRKLSGKSGFTVDELLDVGDALSIDLADLLRLARDAA